MTEGVCRVVYTGLLAQVVGRPPTHLSCIRPLYFHLGVMAPLPACFTASNSENRCAENVLISDHSGLIRKLCVELIPDY